ncbi:MAG: hypothetical protein JWM90_300 [Thermoleophilia bacterium]|nr:hypothetical protein [Thermoleophilia bacterium]
MGSAFRFDMRDVDQATLRFYLYANSLPAVNQDVLGGALPNTTTAARVGRLYVSPTGQTQLGYKNAANTAVNLVNGPVISAGTWYRIDMAINTQGTTWTTQWSVNGAPQTPTNLTGMSADTMNQFQVGSATGSDVAQFTYDDFAVTDTTADYPIGAGGSLGYRIDGAGTHATPGSFQDNDSTAIDATSWTRLDDPIPSMTDFVKQTTTGSTSYLEWTLQNTALTSTANWVSAVMASHSSSSTSVTGTTKVVRSGDTDGAAPVLHSGNMATNTTLGTRQAIIPAPVAGWTPSEVNALKIRMGYVNPVGTVPYWDSAMVEVDSPDGPTNSPTGAYTDDANASAGATNPTTITSSTPHFSFLNSTGGVATLERTQVLSSPLDDVVALWHLDSATGITTDSSGNGRTLTGFNGPTTTGGPSSAFNQATHLNGTSQYYSTPSNAALNLTSNFTLETWFRATTVSGSASPTIVGRQNNATTATNYEIYFDSASKDIFFSFSKGNGATWMDTNTPGAALLDGAWHHVAGSYDGTNARLYVDGVLKDTTAFTGLVDTPAQPITIGRDNTASTMYFKGDVDDVRLSSVVRSAAEILGAYRTTAPHATVLWDSSTSDAGNALASCAKAARCADITYGATGTPIPLSFGGARYWVTTKLKGSIGSWSAWSTADWFEMGSEPRPTTPFVHDTNAASGAANPTNIVASAPHFSFVNATAGTADRHRTQVLTSPLTNVVSLWHMDTATTATTDSSGMGHPLTITGATTGTHAGFADALTFTTTGKEAIAAASPDYDMPRNFTVEAWFRTSSIANDPYPTITGKIDAATGLIKNWEIVFDRSTTTLDVNITVDNGSSRNLSVAGAALVDGNWHHVATVVDAGNVWRLYVDGVEVTSTPLGTAVVDTPSNKVSIGSDGMGGSWFNGDIDEVRISKVARSAAEILGYFNTGAPHAKTMWDSDASDTGTAIPSCALAARCSDITYGSTGTPSQLLHGNARYWVTTKLRAGAGAWSAWSTADWFETDPPPAPTSQYVHDTNAQAGWANLTDVSSATPHFSWINPGSTVNQQRVQVFNDVIDADVLGLWHFDTATGATADGSGNGRTLTMTGTPTAPAGQAGFAEAIGLNGTTQHARAAAHASFNQTNDYSVQARFKASGIAVAFPTLVEESSGGCAGTCNFALQFVQSGSKFQATTTVGGVQYVVQTTAVGLTDGLWHSATMTVDSGNTLRLYVDGGLAGSIALPGPSDTPAGGVYIGASQTLAAASRFTGQLDDVRILGRALSAAEVAGYDASVAPHGTLMWDSSPTGAGVALASCAQAARCADIVYGTGGGSTALATGGARYYVRAKVRAAGDVWSPWSTPDWFMSNPPSLSIGLAATLPLGTAVANGDVSASTAVSVTTNASHGYTLLATDGSDTTGGGLLPAFTTTIPDWTGTNATPTTWATGVNGGTGYLGVSVIGVTGPAGKLAKWGTGVTNTDYVNNKYAGLRLSTGTTLHTRSSYSAAAENVTFSVRLGISSTVPPGNFEDTITISAVANP